MDRHQCRRDRHLQQSQPPLTEDDPSPLEPTTLREGDVARSPSKKTHHTSSSTNTSSVTVGSDVWSDLLECLLHKIITLICSLSDLLAFSGTCHSWRTALSSLPSILSFNIPPLYLQPHIRYPTCNLVHAASSPLDSCEWKLTNPGKRSSSHWCSPPQNHTRRMKYLGCSYGHLIFSNSHHCLLVDVFSGITMRPPRLNSTGNHNIYYGVLDGSINSSNSNLLLCSRSSLFQWNVGSHSWLEHPIGIESIIQIISFKGKMYAMDWFDGIYTIHLAPQLSVQELEVDLSELWGDNDNQNMIHRLVVCDDMLLLVVLCMSHDNNLPGHPNLPSTTFKVFRLDLSVVPARWAKMEKLANHAIFVSFDVRSSSFCCKNPERWGGKSNNIYIASQPEGSDELWTVVELGQVTPPCQGLMSLVCRSAERTYNLWVLPSMVYDMVH